jgi:hypothetical protein
MRGVADSLIVAGNDLEAPVGLRVRNYRAKEVSRFAGRDRTGRLVNELILHETVTRSTAAAVRVLGKRRLGVHLIVGPDGTVNQHGDLAHDRLAHAGGHNGPSVGIEIVNPFYPKYLKASLPWKRVIEAPWGHQGRYVVPTPEQAEATVRLMGVLTGSEIKGLSIPRKWRGLVGTKLAMGRVADGDRRNPGIWAHCYFHHADGAWPALYAWLRLEAGLSPCFAYEEAIRRATGVRRHIELSDLIPHSTA